MCNNSDLASKSMAFACICLRGLLTTKKDGQQSKNMALPLLHNSWTILEKFNLSQKQSVGLGISKIWRSTYHPWHSHGRCLWNQDKCVFCIGSPRTAATKPQRKHRRRSKIPVNPQTCRWRRHLQNNLRVSVPKPEFSNVLRFKRRKSLPSLCIASHLYGGGC